LVGVAYELILAPGDAESPPTAAPVPIPKPTAPAAAQIKSQVSVVEAVPMPDHPAGYQVCFFYRQERIPAVTNQLPVAAHGNQPAAKGFYTFKMD
ncbi:MAG TPA: hypothetical protein VLB84_01085, partial [Bacteroidia bacterium]|nr:hypothetical protein [Bacteroidia bacterium]